MHRQRQRLHLPRLKEVLLIDRSEPACGDEQMHPYVSPATRPDGDVNAPATAGRTRPRSSLREIGRSRSTTITAVQARSLSMSVPAPSLPKYRRLRSALVV